MYVNIAYIYIYYVCIRECDIFYSRFANRNITTKFHCRYSTLAPRVEIRPFYVHLNGGYSTAVRWRFFLRCNYRRRRRIIFDAKYQHETSKGQSRTPINPGRAPLVCWRYSISAGINAVSPLNAGSEYVFISPGYEETEGRYVPRVVTTLDWNFRLPDRLLSRKSVRCCALNSTVL